MTPPPGLTCHTCRQSLALALTRRRSRAKRICEGCPVKDKCLADGLKADKLGAYGIWGGLDPDERGRLGVGS